MSDTTVSYGHAAAFFLLTFGIGLLPPVGVSVMGMKVLGVFLGLLYGLVLHRLRLAQHDQSGGPGLYGLRRPRRDHRIGL